MDIRTCSQPSDLDVAAIEVNDICSPCVYMSFSDIMDKTFISVLINVIEICQLIIYLFPLYMYTSVIKN